MTSPIDPFAIIGARVGNKPTPTERPTVVYLPQAGGSAYSQRALEAECERVAGAQPGERNHTLNRAAFSLAQLVSGGALEHNDTVHALTLAARQAGLDDTEIRRTIASGFKAGAENPRGVPERPDPDAWLAGLPPAEQPPPTINPETGEITQPTAEEIAELRRKLAVARALDDLRIKDEATRLFRAEVAARTFREPSSRFSLTEELLEPDQPTTYAIDELLPTGGNALLAAQFKAGKTTLVTNLLRAYADQEPFLGRFTVNPGAGRIAIFNYELSPDQYRRWLRDAGIRNTDAVAVLHLRGYRLPLTAPSVEDWIVNWLTERNVSCWIADPFARAATGTDENSNTEVGVWLDTFDVIKQRAGVSEGIIPTHTGRAEMEAGHERARGATRLDDWADVRWLLTRDEDSNRFFRATGRDVDIPEELLTFHETDRSLVIGGGDRRWVKNRALSQTVLDFINANPGCGVKAIQQGVKGNKEQIDSARIDLVRRHRVRTEDGARGAIHHFGNEETA